MQVDICFSSDNNYAKYLGAAIKSLIDHASPSNTYILHVFDGGISEINLAKLKSLETDNCHIDFIAVKEISDKIDFQSLHVDGHITVATYYRLVIPELFKDIDRIIYTDCDVIFNCDIADMFTIDIGNNYLGAIKDIGLIYNLARKKIDDKYYKKVIGVDTISDYFNAGVILYDLKNIRQYNSVDILDVIKTLEKPKFHDQCYLNIWAKGKVTYLPFDWNYEGDFKFNYPSFRDKLPQQYIDEFENASKNPCIVHSKQWLNPDNEYSELFFNYARMTPFYESIIYENIKKQKIRKEIKIFGLKIKYKI